MQTDWLRAAGRRNERVPNGGRDGPVQSILLADWVGLGFSGWTLMLRNCQRYFQDPIVHISNSPD